MDSTALEQGIRLFQAGRLEEAAQACSRHLRERPGDPRALHLLGRIHLKRGRPSDALPLLQIAVAAEPANAQVMLSLGSTFHACGDLARAAEAFQHATRIAPLNPAGWFNLGVVRRRQEDLRAAILAFREAARQDPRDFDAYQNVVTTLAAAVRRGEILFDESPVEPRAPAARTPISIVVCSIDPERLRRFVAGMEPHLGDRAHEIVVIRDARSLTEGYRRGWERSRHPIVVFCHDDFTILSPDPFGKLESALESADIVGLAGSTRAAGPAVLWAGHPDVHGCIVHPSKDGKGHEFAVLSLRMGLIKGAQTLDGVFLAMRRDVPARIMFDESTFDGFHFYDLDFTYRAARAGLEVSITTDIIGRHDSPGNFGADFERYSERFRRKFPELIAPRGPNHHYAADLDNTVQVLAFAGQLRALAQA